MFLHNKGNHKQKRRENTQNGGKFGNKGTAKCLISKIYKHLVWLYIKNK